MNERERKYHQMKIIRKKYPTHDGIFRLTYNGNVSVYMSRIPKDWEQPSFELKTKPIAEYEN